MKVGDYVRTKYGISKIENISPNEYDKATDILDNSSHYLKICVDNDLTPMQLASKILKGEIEVGEQNGK